MTAIIASIDIGSHTARLLVALTGEPSSSLTPLVRKRAYTRLAGEFAGSGRRIIPRSAVERLIEVLNEFLSFSDHLRVTEIRAVATGVLREAENGDQVLGAVRRSTGIDVRCLTGVEEAALTSTGVVHALGLGDVPYLIFDLGGGSTEVVVHRGATGSIASLPLGASVLTRQWLGSDPPAADELIGLESAIDKVLDESGIQAPGPGSLMVGTGGTVTALAAALEGAAESGIVPERMNGVVLDLSRIKKLIHCWKTQSVGERMTFSGLDEGRAEVIVAGTMAVCGIMRRFGARRLTVCMSDLLEGLILNRRSLK